MNSEITNAFADRLERIESMLLAMSLSDGKKPTQHEPIKIQSEPSQTIVCKVRYDILASNIKNKLHECFAGKGIEDLAFLNEINFEDLILSSLDTTESNEQPSSSTTIIKIDESRRDDVVSSLIHKNDTHTEPQPTTTSKTATSLKETAAPRAKKEAAPKADKEALKAEKDAQKAEQNEMKSCEKETREYDKALQKAKIAEAKLAAKPRIIPDKEAKKAEKEAEEAKKKAEKEAEEAKKKAEKEALKAEKEALKAEKEAQKKAEKEAADAKKKAEKEAADEKKKAEKEAKKSSTSKPRKSKDATTTSASGESISNTQTQSMSQPSQIMEDEFSEHSNESTTSKSSSKSLSLVHPDQFKSQEPVGIIRKSTPITANPSLINDEDEDEDNSTNTYDDAEEDDEDEDMDNKTDYEILTNWSIPSKPEVAYFAKRGQYVYECVKTEENPEGSINWNVSVGWLTSGGKHILTKSYAHYGDLIVKT
jgi:hypothetical protein